MPPSGGQVAEESVEYNPTPNERDLRKAAHEGNISEVKRLIRERTAVDAGDSKGTTALGWAAAQGHVEVIESLVGAGADVNKKISESGGTPLIDAAAGGHIAAVRKLLDLGADHTAVGTRGSWNDMTALEIAEGLQKYDVANVLREWAESHP